MAPVGVTRIVDRQDVRMGEAGGDLDLAQEALGADHRCDFGPEHLQRDEPPMPEITRQKDRGGAPTSELPLDRVPPGQHGLQAVQQVRHRGPENGVVP